MKSEIHDEFLIFRTGAGEWYNQPHNRRWDMGEDAAAIPPAGWHLALRSATLDAGSDVRRVVVDTTELTYLVGQDWGFLLGFSRDLASRGIRLSVVARANNVKAGTGAKLDRYLDLAGSLDEVLDDL